MIRRVLDGLTEQEQANLVAIVDPPRQGLHGDVIKMLRACAPLRRLLFVSCHVPGFVHNAVALCRPPSNTFKGHGFVPTKLMPLDLFPHTEHCELVVVLERPPLDDAPPVAAAEAAEEATPSGATLAGAALSEALGAEEGGAPM